MNKILLGIGVLSLGVAVAAQKKDPPPLGAVAKAAQEQKAKTQAAEDTPAAAAPAKPKEGTTKATTDKATTDTKPVATEKVTAKKYTNQDLDGSRPGPSAPRPRLTSTSGDLGKDEGYWRARAENVRQRLQYSKDRLNAAKAQLDRARTEGPLYIPPKDRRTSSIEAERNRLAAQVRDLEADVRRDEQERVELEEDARRAGALPGWLR